MEGYMDFTLFALLNIKEMDWEDDFFVVKASNYLAIVFLVVSILLPIGMCFFWAWNAQKWNRDEFKEKYGSLLEGTNMEFKERQWVIMLVPLTYFLRRLGLCIVCVFFIDFFWAQAAL